MKIENLECPNCGAKINKNQSKCEYCNSTIMLNNKNQSNTIQNNGIEIISEMKNLKHKALNKHACIITIVMLSSFILLSIIFIIVAITHMKDSPFGIVSLLPFVIPPSIFIIAGITSIVYLSKKLIKKSKEEKNETEDN